MDRGATPGDLVGRLCVLGAALCFSTGGAAIKAASLSGAQVAGLRALLALAALALFVPGRARMLHPMAAAIGAAQGLTMVLFVLANTMTTAANAIFLQCTGQLYVPLLAPRLLGERVTRGDLWAVAAAAAGMSLFFVGSETPQTTAPRPRLGDALAIASGATWALTIMGIRYSARDSTDDVDAKASMMWGNVIAAALTLPLAFPFRDISLADAGVVAYLGVVQVGLAYALLARGMRTVSALEAAILILFEPVLNPIWAYLVHGERPSEWALAGAAVIAGVTLVRAFALNAPRRAAP